MLKPPIQNPGGKLRQLMSESAVLLPGVFNPISAISAQRAGAKGLYVSGAGITNANLGVPDVALASLTEFAQEAARITAVSMVPVLSDADTGFGEVWNVMRTVIEMERSGLAGIHLEDQVSPKRCGHLDGKTLISTPEMCAKIKAAVTAKSNQDFMIFARTDAKGVEGLEVAISRSKAYLDSGADAIFPEGLESIEEFEAFRKAIKAPLLANMTEFGKTPIIPFERFAEIGYEIVIYPMTAFRVMLKCLDHAYETLLLEGHQESLLNSMRSRKELYSALEYSEYENLDHEWSQ